MRASMAGWLVLVAAAGIARGQDLPPTQDQAINRISPLDPTRAITSPALESKQHTPLPEEYIWTAADTGPGTNLIYAHPALTEHVEPHFFRASFQVTVLPHQATLYLAGPRRVKVWINGTLAEDVESDVTSPLGMHVFRTDVAKLLRPGTNLIAVEAVRGRGVSGFANSALVRQQTFGQVMVGKIVPAGPGVEAPALLRTGTQWKSASTAASGWERAGFDDASWKPVQSLGGIESSIELFQWNADAGLYDWPGYDGISGFLAHLQLPAHTLLASFQGRGSFDNLASLTGGAGEFTVNLPAGKLSDAEAPSVVLDFGRELTGRVAITSDSDQPLTVTVQVGESESEAMKAPYLGVNQLTVAPHGTGYGPKTAFRYAMVRFVGGPPQAHFKSIAVDHIFYPVTYAGSFESNDPMLNRIWEVGAYTAHLCMQDGVWDASKRDRGRWMGDMDVSGRVIEDVFGERPLMEDTLDRLLGPQPARGPDDQHVNGIPGYSAFWFTGVADFYRHTGDKAFLEREHTRMVELLDFVDKEFDQHSIYANKSNVWLYVDWSPELNGDTPETRRATTLEFFRAYKEAVFLLRELGDTTNANRFEARLTQIKSAAEQFLLTPETGTFGPRWQTNAAAIVGGVADQQQYSAIWDKVLADVAARATHGYMGDVQPKIISPYYNFYVIQAMAKVGHRQEALTWIRQYWGGMLAEGATSFWEAYDPDWFKEDFHASLQADNRSGYFVSLAHGWSAGPTAWLMEQVLGIEPTGPGFETVDIRPDLIDLEWVRGAEPTPQGLLRVEARKDSGGTKISVDVPQGVLAQVAVPGTAATLNGAPSTGVAAEGGTRTIVTLDHAGHFELTGR